MKRDSDGNPLGKEKPRNKLASVEGEDNAAFRGYINLNLSDDQKAAFDAWANHDTVRSAVDYQVSSGVNLSLKRERKTGGFLGSATQRDPASPNAGLCVTARGRSAPLAWGRLLFCLTILSEFERWEDTQPLANPDRW